jgi:hypothetical protein
VAIRSFEPGGAVAVVSIIGLNIGTSVVIDASRTVLAWLAGTGTRSSSTICNVEVSVEVSLAHRAKVFRKKFIFACCGNHVDVLRVNYSTECTLAKHKPIPHSNRGKVNGCIGFTKFTGILACAEACKIVQPINTSRCIQTWS